MSPFSSITLPDLAGKRVLLTGGSTGIGAAVALALAAQGVQLVVHYNASGEAAEQLRAQAPEQITLLQGDLGQPGEVARVVAEAAALLGGLDGLINNAGAMLGRVPTTAASEEHFDDVLNLNARSVWQASIAAHPHLKAAGGGFIINTSSIAARNGGGGGAVLYAAAKSFVSSLTRGQAKEFVADHIRVNAVAPGLIETPFHVRDTPPAVMAAQSATIPMGRAGLPDECVGAYLFLASQALSGYITGQVIEVNGGQLMP
ncbi:SDR family NAD(P)-dependent oxidoreductase [Janthinobacterium aquaticum]|uniref:SDR family NAD(P)-dependent oxidoreductase n=1 Tax=Janthinobacterium sp. FT58W TaxID=2654254 RepID=UPI0012653952|nr:SDR family NAD(P)-dependent oxidoreductase [Janthinobacterium sp. FT58W]KAB8038220.1 SDR family oxidoreductase [Janthinobacterium sp. FT58W]